MKKIIIIVSVSIVSIFFVLWGLLDFVIIPSTHESNITNSEWITFIATYSAGTLGGLIALLGIWAQLSVEKNGKKDRVKKYISFVIQQNIKNNRTLENMMSLESSASYTKRYLIAKGEVIHEKAFLNFDKKYFEDNIDTILSFKSSESLVKLNNDINNFNNFSSNYLLNCREKKQLINNIKKTNDINEEIHKIEIITNNRKINRIENIIDLIEIFSSAIFAFQIEDYTSFSMSNQIMKIILTSNFSSESKKEEAIINIINISDDIRKIIKMDQVDKLKLIIKFKKEILSFLLDKTLKLEDQAFKSDLCLHLIKDLEINGKGILIYEKLKEISEGL